MSGIDLSDILPEFDRHRDLVCDLCGTERATPKGMASHRSSDACKRGVRFNRLRDKGWELTHGYAPTLLKAGIEVRQHETNSVIVNGSFLQAWAPQWAVVIAGSGAVGPYTNFERCRYRTREEALLYAKKDPVLQRALVSVAMMTDHRKVCRLLRMKPHPTAHGRLWWLRGEDEQW